MSITNKKAYVFEMNLVTANILGFVVFVLMAVFTFFYFGYVGFFSKPFILTIMIGYFFLHEFMHGLGYLIGGCRRENIAYGVLLEKGIFYCMSYQEITKKNILISLQMPFTVIGVITYIIALVFHLPVLAWLSVLNFMGASMDMAMFYYISRIKNVTYSESGAPNEFVLITEEDLSKKKYWFMNLKEVRNYKKEDYEFKDFKRLQWTKTSLIILLFIFALDIISLLLG